MERDFVLDKLRAFDPATRLAHWLRRPASAALLADFVVAHAPRVVDMLDSEPLQEFVRGAARDKMRRMDTPGMLADLLAVLTRDGRHAELVDSLLDEVAVLADDPDTHQLLAERIRPHLWTLARWVHVDTALAENIAGRVAAGFRDLLVQMSDDKQHDLRRRLDAKIPLLIERLRSDPDLRARIDAFRDHVLDNRELSQYINELWADAMNWLRADLHGPDSTIGKGMRGAARQIGERLHADATLRAWLNQWIVGTVDPLVGEYRERIRDYIAARVHAWSITRVTENVELGIGGSLQSIRISGTLVGAAIGGVLFGLTHLIRFLGG